MKRRLRGLEAVIIKNKGTESSQRVALARPSLNLPWAFWTVLRRWYVLLTALFVVVALFYLFWSGTSPTYSATARLTYAPTNLSSLVGREIFPEASFEDVGAEAVAIASRRFAERVAAQGALDASPQELLEMISVVSHPQIGVVDIRATAHGADATALVANLFAQEYLELRQERAVSIVRQARDSVEALLAQLDGEQAESSYALELQEAYRDLGMQLELQEGDFELLEPAVVPLSPSSPGMIITLAVGLFLGTLAGLALALLIESRDTRLKRMEEVAQISSLPVLTVLPSVHEWWRPKRKEQAIGFTSASAPDLDAYRNLHALLKEGGLGRHLRTLLVTSSVPREGKSTTAVNLALAIALSGGKVQLVDVDLRRPQIGAYLRLPEHPGLLEVLSGSASWDEATQSVDPAQFFLSLHNQQDWEAGAKSEAERLRTDLTVVTGGAAVTAGLQVAEEGAVRQTIARLTGDWDYTILDGPPLLGISDAVNILDLVDAVLFVARLGLTTREEMRGAKKLLHRSGAQPLGAVVTGSRRPAAAVPFYPHQDVETRPVRSEAWSDQPSPRVPSLDEVEVRFRRLELGEVPWDSDG